MMYKWLAKKWKKFKRLLVILRRCVRGDSMKPAYDELMEAYLEALMVIWENGKFYGTGHGWQGFSRDANEARDILIKHGRLAEDGGPLEEGEDDE
jgi:hypothetical protein